MHSIVINNEIDDIATRALNIKTAYFEGLGTS